ncbi:DUF3592 domain-containing protein [Massilia sp. R2A-15]|uniref:DUF3592 domain-containing protein n=1 Tax=Massilia sp. R2A-15 TaxID=3064278 RepID=UPI0027364DBD|nr:DUF3592 domain-containing protein [Massilia sp. R2A-15]WLI90443.1 DUF3592 domain-containing protein [Massilia sp. R2A-15]
MGAKPFNLKKTQRFGWLCIIIALPLAYYSLMTVIDKARSKAWPGADAKVIQTEAYKSTRAGAYCFQLRYQYAIAGKEFSSTRWTLKSRVACNRDKHLVDAALEQLQPDATIRIRYDPTDPGKSFVDPEDVDFTDVFYIVLAFGLIVYGLFVPRALARKKTKHRSDGALADGSGLS